MNMFRNKNRISGFSLVELIVVVCLIGLLAALIFTPCARAQVNGYPLGADIISDGVNSNNFIIPLTNTTGGALIITNTVVWTGISSAGKTSDSVRVSALFGGDPNIDFYVSPAPLQPVAPGATNFPVVTGGITNWPIFGPGAGIKVGHGTTGTNNFTTARPSLINMPLAFSAFSTVAAGAQSNVVINPARDLFHQPL